MKIKILRDKTIADKLMFITNQKTHNHPSVDFNQQLKRLDTQLNERTNQNSIKVSKVFKPTNKKSFLNFRDQCNKPAKYLKYQRADFFCKVKLFKLYLSVSGIPLQMLKSNNINPNTESSKFFWLKLKISITTVPMEFSILGQIHICRSCNGFRLFYFSI